MNLYFKNLRCHGLMRSFHFRIHVIRFAQRVAMIKNDAQINEEVDPYLVIRRMRQEMLALKEEVG